MPLLAQSSRSVVFSSAVLEKATVSHPSLLALPKGRLIASLDVSGPGVKSQPGKKGRDAVTGHLVQSRILVSEDGGASWKPTASLPFGAARLFRVGAGVYALGHTGNLCIGHSSDGGSAWRCAELTTATGSHNRYTLGPANVLVDQGMVTAALTVLTDPACKGNSASAHAIVLARASTGANLEKPSAWQFSREEPAFREQVSERAGHGIGLPWYHVPKADRSVDLARNRWANRIGWTEAHVARLRDPGHVWYGEQTLHVLAGVYSHRANIGSLLRADLSDAAMPLGFEHTPAGQPVPFLPVPGGHQKFDLLYDEPTGLHWLAGVLPSDSMTRLDALGRERPGLPCDERSRIALHVSRNLVDWHCVGVVCEEPVVYEPAMAVRGDDLHLVARAAPADPSRPHNTLEIVRYQVEGFRRLV